MRRRGHLPCPAGGDCRARVRVPAGGVRRRRQSAPPTAGARAAERRSRNADNAGKHDHGRLKNFTEQFILGEIYAQALEAAGYEVKKDLNLGSEQIALQGAQGRRRGRLPRVHEHRADLVLRRAAAGHPDDARAGGGGLAGGVRQEGLVAYDPRPFTSANAVGMLKKKADELGVTKVSDLEGKSQDLTLYGLARVPPAAWTASSGSRRTTA